MPPEWRLSYLLKQVDLCVHAHTNTGGQPFSPLRFHFKYLRFQAPDWVPIKREQRKYFTAFFLHLHCFLKAAQIMKLCWMIKVLSGIKIKVKYIKFKYNFDRSQNPAARPTINNHQVHNIKVSVSLSAAWQSLFWLFLETSPLKTNLLQHQHVGSRCLLVTVVIFLSHTKLSR